MTNAIERLHAYGVPYGVMLAGLRDDQIGMRLN